MTPSQVIQTLLKPEFGEKHFSCRYIALNWIRGDLFGGFSSGRSKNCALPSLCLVLFVVSCRVEEQKKSTPEYTWQSAGVLDYSPEKKQYLVQKADQNGCVRDSKGKPVVGGAQGNKGKC